MMLERLLFDIKFGRQSSRRKYPNNKNNKEDHMSYLSRETSNLDYGVVKVGNYINVVDGLISLPQDLSPTANVSFNGVDAISSISLNGTPVVYGLNAGPGISLSSNHGTITVSATGADLIHVYGTTTNYTATADDEYIGVNSVSAVTITLPVSVNGRVYTVKDEHGNGSGKITIQPPPGELIDGKTNYIISVPYQGVNIVCRTGNWWII